MRKILFLTLILFGSVVFVQAQETPKAIKVDEFPPLEECDSKLRWEFLLDELDKYPNAKIYAIGYQKIDALPGDYGSPLIFRSVENAFRFLRIDQSKVKLVFGGFRKKEGGELWIVPNGAEEPQPTDILPKPEIPTDRTFLFGKKYLINYYLEEQAPFEFLLNSTQKEHLEMENEIEEENKKDGITDSTSVETETLSKEEIEEAKFFWKPSNFGEFLKNQKDLTGIIIFYGDEEYYDIQAIHTHLVEGRERIAQESQISTDRIKIIYGGYRGRVEADFWVVPKAGQSPKPTQDSYLFDEFEKLNERNLKLRLAKYQHKIYCSSPDSFYFIIYGPNKVTAESLVKKYLNYLVKMKCPDPPSIVIIFGGIEEKHRTEVWVVPPGAEVPDLTNR
jgi:hypothetical protein